MVGTCKLCLRENRELKDSHLMPAGMHRRVLSQNADDPNVNRFWTERGRTTHFGW